MMSERQCNRPDFKELSARPERVWRQSPRLKTSRMSYRQYPEQAG